MVRVARPGQRIRAAAGRGRAPAAGGSTVRGRHQTTPGDHERDERPGGDVAGPEVADADLLVRRFVAGEAPDGEAGEGELRRRRRRSEDPVARAPPRLPGAGEADRPGDGQGDRHQVAGLLDRLRVDETQPDREEVDVDRREDQAADRPGDDEHGRREDPGRPGEERPDRGVPAPGRPRPSGLAHAWRATTARCVRPRPQASTGRSIAAWTTAPAARVSGSPTAVRTSSSVHGPPTRPTIRTAS